MRVQSTKDISQNRLKILIYGQAGVGKTSLAATLNEKVLIISAEAGLLSLAGHDIDTIDLTLDDNGEQIEKEKRAQRLGEVFGYVCEEETRKKYDWLFLDSLTEISQNMIEALALVYTDPKDTIKMWGDYNKKARALIKNFRDLPYYNVAFTALEAVDKDENNRRYIRPDMQGGIGKQLCGFFDEVLYMYIDDTTDTSQRAVATQPRENVQAKDRSGCLNALEKPDLQVIVDKIRAGKTKTKKETKKATKDKK